MTLRSGGPKRQRGPTQGGTSARFLRGLPPFSETSIRCSNVEAVLDATTTGWTVDFDFAFRQMLLTRRDSTLIATV